MRPAHRFLAGALIYIGLLANLLLYLRAYDALLVSFLVPIVWAAFLYPRWVYLSITMGATAASVLTLYGLFLHPITSLLTVGATLTTAVAICELLQHLLQRQRRLGAELKDAEEKFRHLATHLDQVFWLQKPNSPGLAYASPAAEKVWGTWTESLQQDRGGLLDAVVPEDRERVQEFLETLASERGEIEYRLAGKKGAVRWVRERAFPVKEETGECSLIVGIAEDITERTMMAGQLHQAQKIECVGRMACAVAHDLNNILTVIRGQAELIKFEGGMENGVRDGLQEITASVERAENLTRQLLASARKQELAPRDVDLNEVACSAMRVIRRALDETVVLIVETAPMPLPVFVDGGSIEQILMNLVINARDAMPHGGQVKISTRVALAEGDGGERLAALVVSDTGHGIEKENLARIFEPFFTTKPLGKGTGLGLSTVESIVRQHGGKVRVRSEVGQGTSFEVVFPLLKRTLEREATPVQPHLKKGEGTILLVEDDAAVREVTRSFLQRLGYTVLEARTALAALTIWNNFHVKIDLLVTDMVLPDGSGGEQLAKDLLRSDSDLPIIFTTGYSGERSQPEVAPEAPVFRKPYDLRRLAQSVSELLKDEGSVPGRNGGGARSQVSPQRLDKSMA